MGGNYSREIYTTRITEPREGESGIYRKIGHEDALITKPKCGLSTLQELYLSNFRDYGERDFLGSRIDEEGNILDEYKWMSYAEVEQTAKALGSGIINLGLTEAKKQFRDYEIKFVGIYSKNTIEWKLIDTANILYGFTTMPVYDSLGVEATKFMFNQTELSTVFLTCSHVKGVAEGIKSGELQHVKNLVILDQYNLTDELKEDLDGVKYYMFSEVIEAGKKELHDYHTPQESDILFVSYTSGTTGNPKGAIFTNANVMSTIGGTESYIPFPDFCTHISYLPLVHIFERYIVSFIQLKHGRIGFYQGDPKKLTLDMQVLKPDFMISVPRIYNKFYDAIKKKLESLTGAKGYLARKALATKLYYFNHGRHVTHSVYDQLVFNKIKQMLGGNIKYLLTGSAPISEEVRRFLSVVFCCEFAEGYGQTEAVAAEFVTRNGDNDLSHVGGLSAQLEMKVIDVPEMNYFSTDVDENGVSAPRGELLVRGAGVIPGYYKNEEKTAELLDKDGWMHSGDIVKILPGSNAVRIIDRRKNIFKLSIGEYVAPDKLEQEYKLIDEVSDMLVYGDSLKNYLVAVIFSEESELTKVAASLGVEGTYNELCENETIKQHFIDRLEEQSKASKMNRFQYIRKISLTPQSFADQELLTSTFKLRRFKARAHFHDLCQSLYNE